MDIYTCIYYISGPIAARLGYVFWANDETSKRLGRPTANRHGFSRLRHARDRLLRASVWSTAGRPSDRTADPSDGIGGFGSAEQRWVFLEKGREETRAGD